MEYGLYIARSKNPVHIGTPGACRAQVDLLTDEEKRSGWTIGPIPLEPPPLPVDQGLLKRILVLGGMIVVVALVLALVLWARGYFS